MATEQKESIENAMEEEEEEDDEVSSPSKSTGGPRMGRRKITIEKIPDIKTRQVTFNKRKVGLMKKAIELAVLCGCEVGLLIFHSEKMYQYSSKPIHQIIQDYHDYQGTFELVDNSDLSNLRPGKSSSIRLSRKKKSLDPMVDIEEVLRQEQDVGQYSNVLSGRDHMYSDYDPVNSMLESSESKAEHPRRALKRNRSSSLSRGTSSDVGQVNLSYLPRNGSDLTIGGSYLIGGGIGGNSSVPRNTSQGGNMGNRSQPVQFITVPSGGHRNASYLYNQRSMVGNTDISGTGLSSSFPMVPIGAERWGGTGYLHPFTADFGLFNPHGAVPLSPGTRISSSSSNFHQVSSSSTTQQLAKDVNDSARMAMYPTSSGSFSFNPNDPAYSLISESLSSVRDESECKIASTTTSQGVLSSASTPAPSNFTPKSIIDQEEDEEGSDSVHHPLAPESSV